MHPLAVIVLLIPQATPAPDKVVVITASPLDPKDLFDTPYSAEVWSAESLAETSGGLRSIPDALREATGVSIQKTGPAQGSPFIRGFTGFRNVMLIDGIRLNNSCFREGPNQYWATVDAFMVDRLEIVRGPSSVLYGSDAIGGTVQAWTKEPAFGEGPAHIRSFGRYASAERSWIGRGETWGSQGDLGWFVGASGRDYGDFQGGHDIDKMDRSGFETNDADVKMVYRLSPGSKLVVAGQRHRTIDSPRWHSTNQAIPWRGAVAGTDRQRDFDQGRELAYLQYRGTFENAAVDSLNASFSFHHMTELEDRITSSGARQLRSFEVRTPGLWVQAGKKTAAGHVTGGLEVYRDSVSSAGSNITAGGAVTTFARGNVADDAAYLLTGIYLQDEITVGCVDLTPGIRFSRAEVDADQVDPAWGTTFAPLDETYQALTGSLRALWHVEEHWNVVAGWGMGFRAPSLDDSTAISLVLSGALDTPATDLDPEKTHTFDIGVRTQQKDFEIGAFAFHTILDDFIQRVPIPDFNGDAIPDFTKQNFSKGYVYGYEVNARVRAGGGLDVFADWGFAKGEADQLIGAVESEQPLAKVGPSLLHVGARFEPAGMGFWVEGLVTAAAHQHHLSVSDGTDTQRIPPGGTPGYTIGTVRGGYRFTPKIVATAAVENVADRDYRVHGSGQNEPGRNLVVGLDVGL